MNSLVAVLVCTVLFVAYSDSRNIKDPHHHHHTQKGYRHYHRDESGEEYLMCMHKDMEEDEVEPGTTKCQARSEPSMGVKPLGLACMGVFNVDGEPLKQGCWIHQFEDVINKTCPHNRCIAESEFGPYFCCCTTPLCNREFVRLMDLAKDPKITKEELFFDF